MSEQLFDKFANLPALEKEKEQVLQYFNDVKTGLMELSKMGFKLDTAKGLAELNKFSKQMEEMQKQLAAAAQKLAEAETKLADTRAKAAKAAEIATKANKDNAKSVRELTDSLDNNAVRAQELKEKLRSVRAELSGLNEFKKAAGHTKEWQEAVKKLSADEALLRIELQKTNRFVNNQARESLAAENSLDSLRAKLNQMLQVYDGMDLDSEDAKQGLKVIQDLTDEISKQEQLSKRFQRSVGNYQGAAKTIVDAFERAQARMQKFGDEVGKQGPEYKQAAREVEAFGRVMESQQFLNVAARIGDVKSETQFLTRSLQALRLQGMQNNETYLEMQKRLAELTDSNSDLKQQVNALASDTYAIDQFSGAINTATSVVQTYIGARELFGDQSEDLQESIRTLMALENVSNGIRSISTELTRKGTLANRAYERVQALYAVATDRSAAATLRLAAASKLLLGGAIIAALIFIVSQISKWGKETNNLSKEQKALNEVRKKSIEMYVDERVQVELLVAEAQKETTSKKRKHEIIKELNEISPTYFGNIKTEKDLTDKLTESMKKYIAAIELKARVEAGTEILKEKYKELYLLQQESATASAGIFEQAFGFFGDLTGNATYQAAALGGAVQKYTEHIGKLKEDITTFKKIVLDDSLALDAAGGDPKPGTEEDPRIAAERKAQAELRKIRLEARAAEQQAIAEFEFGVPAERAAAAAKEFSYRSQALVVMMKEELANEKLTATERIVIREKTMMEIEKLEAERVKKTSQISIDQLNIQKDLDNEMMESAAMVSQVQIDEINKQVDAVKNQQKEFEDIAQKSLDYAQRNLAKQFEKGLMTREEYHYQSAKLDADHQKNVLKNQLIYYGLQMDILKAAGYDTLELEKAIADARKKLAILNLEVDPKEKEAMEEKIRLVNELKEAYKTLGDTIKDAFVNVIEGAFDAQKNQIQDQIDNLEVLKAAEIKKVDQSTDNEEKKAARIAVIEAKAQANREALERRQRQLDRQKAIFNRATQAFEITTTGIATVARLKMELFKIIAASALNPFLRALIPLAAAQIPIAVGTSAAQLVALLATPIPKFAAGTLASPAGWAVAGEAGRELAVEPTGGLKMFDRPTLSNLAAGTVIFPNRVTEDIMATAQGERAAKMKAYMGGASSTAVPQQDNDLQEKQLATLKNIEKKSRILIINKAPIESSAYYQSQMKY